MSLFIWQKTSNLCQYNWKLTSDLADSTDWCHTCGYALITCLLGGDSHPHRRQISGAVSRYLNCQQTSALLMSVARRSDRLRASRIPRELLKGAAPPPCTGDRVALCSALKTPKHPLSIAVSQRCSAGTLLLSFSFFFLTIFTPRRKEVFV